MLKKYKSKLITSISLLIIIAAVTVGYTVKVVMKRDKIPPEIVIDQESIAVSVSSSPEELLAGVSAADETDGDVTSEIVIEGVGSITPEHTAVITYAAFDHSGNVSKASRVLSFTDYQSPRFGQNQALVLTESGTQDVLDMMTAQDVIDGDLSSRIKGNLISNTVSLSEAGMHSVEFRVTNSMSDTARIVLPVDVCPRGVYNARVELSDYLVYLPCGAAFDGAAYLKNLVIGTTEYSLTGSNPDLNIVFNQRNDSEDRHTIHVEMESNVNTAVPGIYSVAYTVSANHDNYIGFTRLNVVVEE